MKFFTTEQVSPRIGKTPDGFLVCYDVPIARTGEMIYNKAESDIMPWLKDFGTDASGNVVILREDSEVFRPETLESLQGKPVTIDHPDDLVNPENWRELAKGTAQNIRRGEREQADLILADLLITDAEAIKYVEGGELRQISVGYDADYEHLGDGRGKQTNIIGNHIALVQRGRAGIRCSIQDSACTGCGKCKCKDNKEVAPVKFKDTAMGKKFLSFFDADMEEEEKKDKKETEDGEPEWAGELKKSLDGLRKSLDCFGKKTKDEAEEEEEEKKKKTEDDKEDEADKKEDEKDAEEEEKKTGDKKTKDAAPDNDLLSRMEILTPGFKPRGVTRDAIMREVMGVVQTSDANLVKPFGVTDFKAAKYHTVDAVFMAVSTLKAERNNAQFITRDFKGASNTTDSPADLNKKYADFWQTNKGR